MRVMTFANHSLGVSAEQEERWPSLTAAALQAVVEGLQPVPYVWFRTDTGVVGALPISDEYPINFTDEIEPVGFDGTITLLGHEAAPSTDESRGPIGYRTPFGKI